MGNQTLSDHNNNPTTYHLDTSRSSPLNTKTNTSQSEVIISQHKFLQWKSDLQKLIKRLHSGDRQKDYLKINCLLLPIKTNYVKNSALCGDQDGKAIIQYEYVFSPLKQRVELHLSKNMPFTGCQLWNLLFTLVQDLSLLEGAQGCFELKYQNIYVDSEIKAVKLATPLSFVAHVQNKPNFPYLKLGKSKPANQKHNHDLKYDSQLVGLVLAECILLQRINNLPPNTQNDNNKLIEKILKLNYYPLKLRLIVAGMIQADPLRRFSFQLIYDLLSPHKQQINTFKQFHISKTDFLSKFSLQLSHLQTFINKIKQQSNQQLFKSNLGAFNFYPPPINSNRQYLFKQQRQAEVTHNHHIPSQLSGSNQSLNISATIPPMTTKHEDMQSLNLSREMKSSLIPERDLIQRNSMTRAYSPDNFLDWKGELRKIQSDVSNKQQQIANQFQTLAQPKYQPLPKDQQHKFKSLSSLSPSHQSQKQLERPQHHPVAEANAEDTWTPPPIESSQPKPADSQNQKTPQHTSSRMENGVRNSDQILIYNDSPIEKGERISEVVQYMSQMYDTDHPILQNKIQNSFKAESDNDYSRNQIDSLLPNEHKDHSRQQEHSNFKHQDSIINELDPLLSSNKIKLESQPTHTEKPFEPSAEQPASLSEAAQKKLDYLNMFKKFSPDVIAQLNLATAYPDSERLKRSMRQKISTHQIVMNKTRKLFPTDSFPHD